MEALLISLALLLLFAAAIGAIGHLRRNLELWRVMARLGIVPPDDCTTQAALARAARRCVRCRSIDRCERWLAGDPGESLDDFCPNARLLRGRNFPTPK